MEVYFRVSGVSEKDGKVQTAIILNCGGPRVLEVYNTFIWTDDGEKDKPDKVLEALERYCNPRDKSLNLIDSGTFHTRNHSTNF